MTDETPLPMARMETINKPSFWIFMSACMALYIYNHFSVPGNGDVSANVTDGNYICMAAFTGLFLTLISGAAKTPGLNRFLTIFCYVFEIIAVLALAAMVIVKISS